MKIKADDTAMLWMANQYGLVLEGLEGFGKSNGRDSATYKWMRIYPSPHVNTNMMSYTKTGKDMFSSSDMACRFRAYRLHESSKEVFAAIPENEKAALKTLGILQILEDFESEREVAA